MAMPSFTAERSLYQTSAHYRGTATFGRAEGTVQLAIIDPNCLAACSTPSCGELCAQYTGTARGKCNNLCGRDVQNCIAECPEVSPPPPPPSGPSMQWCGNKYEGGQSLPCPQGEQCRIRCSTSRDCWPFPPFCTSTTLCSTDLFCQ